MKVSADAFHWAAQLVCCFYMTGVILVIQVIHYPIFSQIDSAMFKAFHSKHSFALGLIAGPIMCLELVSAIWISKNGNPWLALNAVLVAALWLITFLISVPLHNRLALGFDEEAWNRLLKTNWMRTFIWGGRSFVFFIVLIDQSTKVFN